ncbi:MAG: caspase family protein [Acetobacter malorum]|uniref:caspase family protein n=1 Tax=Acetobacter malorum TaxID=178901 RepID=UPI0039EA1246
MRKALIIGINHYDHLPHLTGCVNDANSIAGMLEEHFDGRSNFLQPLVMIADSSSTALSKSDIKNAARELFEDQCEVALFYFAGHGYLEDESSGYLCGSECESGDDGVLLADIMRMASKSPATNKVVILDSCHGGIAGSRDGEDDVAELKEGMTVLTASTAKQSAYEVYGGGGGVFTSLLLDALNGAAANLVGDVTPGSVYAHIDQSLGTWGQRPLFKTNVRRFISLRRAKPPIDRDELKQLAIHFPTPDYQFRLDPSFEPQRSRDELADASIPPPNPENTAIFRVLQNYVKVNLVRPVDAPHMWHAAMGTKACELTVLGKHYRNLVAEKLIR